MKKLLFLFLLVFPIVAFCGKKKPIKPFPRTRWRETMRMKPDSSIVPFNDTMFLSFNGRDTFSYHFKNGFIYNGAYIFKEDSILDLGTVKYRLMEWNPKKDIVLVNENGIYRFGVDSTDTVKTIILPREEKILPVTSIDQMIGHWTVYKKVGAGKGDAPLPDMATQIRSAYITGPSTEGKLGYFFGGEDPGNAPSWFIKNFNDDQTLQCEGKTPRIFKVIKCQKGEMILEDEGMRYFLKQFR
jgi:hypothetical protein